jgi:hypothetical protein
MVNAILSLISNSLISGLAIIGIGTLINKAGKFFKIIEEEQQDGYRKAFDSIMVESIDEINKSVESVGIIGTNINKIFFILYDISTGSKFIKKDKDGKLIICNKSKVYTGYKDKIEELNSKVKQYQEELSKIKKTKNKGKDDEDEKDAKDAEDSDSSLSTDEEDKNDEFYLESDEK